MNKKKITEANKLKEKITLLDKIEMYSLYQILEKNKVNITNNMYGIYFDLLSLHKDVYKTIELFVDQAIERKKFFNNSENREQIESNDNQSLSS